MLKNFVVTSINIKDIGKYDIIDKSSIIPVVKMKKINFRITCFFLKKFGYICYIFVSIKKTFNLT